MINKVNRFLILAGCVILILGCSENRFKKNGDLHTFSFGVAGYDDFAFCKKNDPSFMTPYTNGKYPGKICAKYRQYTCHINYFCSQYKDHEKKQCEKDAILYWTPAWQGTEGNLQKRVEMTKQKCEIEASKN